MDTIRMVAFTVLIIIIFALSLLFLMYGTDLVEGSSSSPTDYISGEFIRDAGACLEQICDQEQIT